MCENSDCSTCELHKNNNKTNVSCYRLANEHPDKAVAIVEEWSKEHPQKTIKDDFLEKYPNAETYEEGIPVSCAKHLGYIGQCNRICSECWNRPLSEVE